ncbi:hypothetical protein YWY31_51030 [Paenibacillus illinoisensis]
MEGVSFPRIVEWTPAINAFFDITKKGSESKCIEPRYTLVIYPPIYLTGIPLLKQIKKEHMFPFLVNEV